MEKHESVEVLLNGNASRTHANAYKDEDFMGNSGMKNGVITLYFKRSPASRAQHCCGKVSSWSGFRCGFAHLLAAQTGICHFSESDPAESQAVRARWLVDIRLGGGSRTSILSISSMSAD